MSSNEITPSQMCRNRVTTQLPGGASDTPTEEPPNSPARFESRGQPEDGNALNAPPNQTMAPATFIHPFMIPHPFNSPYYWPYPHPMVGPYFFPIAAYYFQRPMVGIPLYNPFGVPPPITPAMVQHIETGPITNNFVTTIEIGTDNSTNLKINKNGDRTRNSGSS